MEQIIVVSVSLSAAVKLETCRLPFREIICEILEGTTKIPIKI